MAVASRSTDPDAVASEYKNIVGTDQHNLTGMLAGNEDIVRFAATAR